MPSPAMQDVIDSIRKQQQAGAGQAPPTLAERRATFAPAGRRHPIPGDVQVTDVTAAGVPAHWLAAPGADPGRVLLFLHGGGFQFGSLASDGHIYLGSSTLTVGALNTSTELSGVISDGLTTTVLPAASAAGIFIASEISGPFQVMMTPITP